MKYSAGRRYTHAGMAGFTLIEMLVALGIIAVLMTISVPSFKQQMLDGRMSVASNDLVGTLMSARAESAGRGKFVTVCKKNSDATDCADDGGWEQGWLMFVDEGADGSVDAGDELLYVHEHFAAGLTINATAGAADRVTFRASGMTNLNTAQVMVLCDERGFGGSARGVFVSILGKGSNLSANDAGVESCLAAL